METESLVWILLVVLAIASVSVAAGQFDDSSGFDNTTGEFEQDGGENADTVYIREDGSGVLVYNSSETEEDATVSFGFDAEEGLLHLVGDGTYEDQRSLIGDLSVEVEPSSWLVNGNFEAEEAEFVENVDVDIESQTDEANSELNAGMEMRIPIVAFFDPQAQTEGEVVVEPDSLRSSGSLSYDLPPDFAEEDTSRTVFRFDLSETDNGYLIDERRRTVLREEPDIGELSFEDDTFGSTEPENSSDGFGDTGSLNNTGGFDTSEPTEDWGTRDDALETLRGIYANSSNLDGVGVEIDSYSFENVTTPNEFGRTRNEYLLDIDYSIEYPGLKEKVADAFAENLSQDNELPQETADELSEAVRNLNINSLSYNIDYNSTQGEFSWNLDLENYNDPATAFLNLFSEIEPDELDGNGADVGGEGEISPSYYEDIFNTTLGQWTEGLEAAESSGYVSRWEWSGGLESGVASANLTHETENWEDYVDELGKRDLPIPPESSFDLAASSTESGIEGDLRWEVGGEGLRQRYDRTFDTYRTLLEASEEFNASVLNSIENSGFEVAKMDASVEEGEWTLETGASFGNSTAVSSLTEETTGLAVREAVGSEEDGVVTTYVKVDGLVDETTEESVMSLDQVGEETEVRLPGEWNREFPEMDTDAAKDYLGVGGGSSVVFVFGIVAVFAAVLIVAAVALRRRQEQ